MSDNQKESEVLQEKVAQVEQPEVDVTEGELEAKLNFEDLETALIAAEKKADDAWNQMLSGKAELENARKRMDRDVDNARKFALEKFVAELLPVKDSLELGQQAANAEGADVEKIREGVDLTLKMFRDALDKFGVTEVNPENEKFNPDLHQAMSMQESPDVVPNTVMAVFQKGLQINGRLIRPAMVVVAGPGSGANIPNDEPPTSSQIDEIA